MTARFDADDLVSQQRQAAHLNAARIHEQSSDFYRSVGAVFASLGLDAEVRVACLAADSASRFAECERNHLEQLRERAGDSVAAASNIQ